MTQDNNTRPGVTHDGLPVEGYKPQSESNVAIVNGMKRAEEGVLRLLDTLGKSEAYDKRWLAIARTNIEQGFMAANRAVFQPGRVALPGDEEHEAKHST